jgi:hypothetical protein
MQTIQHFEITSIAASKAAHPLCLSPPHRINLRSGRDPMPRPIFARTSLTTTTALFARQDSASPLSKDAIFAGKNGGAPGFLARTPDVENFFVIRYFQRKKHLIKALGMAFSTMLHRG